MKRSSRSSRILALLPPADSGSDDSDIDLDLSSDAPDIPNDMMDIFDKSDSEDDSFPSPIQPPPEYPWLPDAPAASITILSSPSLANPSPSTSQSVQPPSTPNSIYSNTCSPLIPIASRLLRSHRSETQNQSNRIEPSSSLRQEDLFQPQTSGVEVQRSRKRKKEHMEFKFKSTKFRWPVDRETSVDSSFQEQVTGIDTPYQYFKKIQKDGLHHIPSIVKKGRCRNCTAGQTVISCLKCDTRLCLTEKRNCFREFHTK